MISDEQEKPQTALMNISAHHDYGNARLKTEEIETLGEVSVLELEHNEFKTPSFFHAWNTEKTQAHTTANSPTFRRPVTTNKTIY